MKRVGILLEFNYEDLEVILFLCLSLLLLGNYIFTIFIFTLRTQGQQCSKYGH